MAPLHSPLSNLAASPGERFALQHRLFAHQFHAGICQQTVASSRWLAKHLPSRMGGLSLWELNTWQPYDYDAVTGGSNFSSEYFGTRSFVLVITAVPEPGSVALLLQAASRVVVLLFRDFRRGA